MRRGICPVTDKLVAVPGASGFGEESRVSSQVAFRRVFLKISAFNLVVLIEMTTKPTKASPSDA